MPAKKKIMDITDLSATIADALKEISTGGKSLTLANLSKTLLDRKEISEMISAANECREKTPSEKELESLKGQIESAETRRKELLRQMAEIEHTSVRERDFFRRFTSTVTGLARIPENEQFFDVLDEFKTAMQGNADIEALEVVLKNIRDRLLRADVGSRAIDKGPEAAPGAGGPSGKSLFGKGEKEGAGEMLQKLKTESLIALENLQGILGEEYRASVHLAIQSIEQCHDLDMLVAQKTYILSVIEGYVQRARMEKDQVTGFLRELSERLVEMEKNMLGTHTQSQEVHLDDSRFHENIEQEIRAIHENVVKLDSFENLKSFVVVQLTKISKTLNDRSEEYKSRIENAQRESKNLKKNFKTLIGKVIDKNKALMEEVQRDPLTEIFNRRTYETTLAAEIERFHRYRKPFSLIFFDVDHFKLVNDRYGHDAGDKVLRSISRRVGEVLRKPDVFARYGGEEFVVILPETNLENGMNVALKIREVIEETVFEYEGERVRITVSLGVTEALPADLEARDITARADKYLFRAKSEGRNRVISDNEAK